MKIMKLTDNFNLSEFDCKDGTPVPYELVPSVKVLAKQLQVLRDELNAPITVNSGYRTPAYNKSIGGAENSQHLKAKAADIVVKGYTPIQVHGHILRLIEEGRMMQGGVGLYNTFTHYDIRGYKARW